MIANKIILKVDTTEGVHMVNVHISFVPGMF